jgi:hypothetical protein
LRRIFQAFQILRIQITELKLIKSILMTDLFQESGMIALLSVASVLGGSALAIAADRHIPHREILETCAGTLLFAGFGLLGSVLQHYT